MSEAGKYQYSEKDCEIIYVEEKAPEPWIQRETFYDKDLPFPEDDDERLSDAKHIGSFMVPSPLMRLKTPSSMSSDKSGRSEDVRISPVPSLDRSIKSERRDSKSSLVIISGGLTSSESLPQLFGLFDDSDIFTKESTYMINDAQEISRSPLSVDAEEINRNSMSVDIEESFEDAADEEQAYLATEIEGHYDEDLYVNNVDQRNTLGNSKDFSNENFKRMNHHSKDLGENIPHESSRNKIEPSKFMSETAKDNKHNFRSTSSQMNSAPDDARNNIPMSATSPMKEFATPYDLNLGQEAANAPSIQSYAGVAGSSMIPPAIIVGLGVAAASFNDTPENLREANFAELEDLANQKRNNENNFHGNALLDNSDLGPEISQRVRNAVPIEASGTSNLPLNVVAHDSSIKPTLQDFAMDQNIGGIMSTKGGIEVERISQSTKELEGSSESSQMAHPSMPVSNTATGPLNVPTGPTSASFNDLNSFDQIKQAQNASQEQSISEDNIEVSSELFSNSMINPTLKTIDMRNYSDVDGTNLNEPVMRKSVSGIIAQYERNDSEGTTFEQNGDDLSSNVKSGLGLAIAAGVASSVVSSSANKLAQSEVTASLSEHIPESDYFMSENGKPSSGIMYSSNDVNEAENGNLSARMMNASNDITEAEDGNTRIGMVNTPNNVTRVENYNTSVGMINTSNEVTDNTEMSKMSKISSSNSLGNNNLVNKYSSNQADSPALEDQRTLAEGVGLNEIMMSDLSNNENLINSNSLAQFEEVHAPSMEGQDSDLYKVRVSNLSANTFDGDPYEQLEREQSLASEENLGDLAPSENENSLIRTPKQENEFTRDSGKTSSTEIENEAVKSPTLPDGVDQLSSIPLLGESGAIYHVNSRHLPGVGDIQLSSALANQEDEITSNHLNNRSLNNDYNIGSDQVESHGVKQSDENNSIDLDSLNNREARIEDNIEFETILNRPSDEEIALLLSAFDSQLASELGQLAEHFADNDVNSDQYAKEWFESVFSDPKFSPAFSEKASSIYEKQGPTGLVEVALDLVKANSDELLALDSNEEILKKLNSNMKSEEENSAQSGLLNQYPELFSSLHQNDTSEADDQLCDTRLELLVAKWRNAEDLIKQLSDLIQEMNEDIKHLTCENNKKSLRIKSLENSLQEKMKK